MVAGATYSSESPALDPAAAIADEEKELLAELAVHTPFRWC